MSLTGLRRKKCVAFKSLFQLYPMDLLPDFSHAKTLFGLYNTPQHRWMFLALQMNLIRNLTWLVHWFKKALWFLILVDMSWKVKSLHTERPNVKTISVTAELWMSWLFHVHTAHIHAVLSVLVQCFLTLFCIVLKYISLMWNVFYSEQ